MSLFTPYEERPPFCQAVPVWFDTIEDIAHYYSDGRYETKLHRSPEGVTLTISHPATERHEAFEMTMNLPTEIIYSGENQFRRQVLIYGHPPTLADYDEFRANWREAKELP
jgi:hypothetical protein